MVEAHGEPMLFFITFSTDYNVPQIFHMYFSCRYTEVKVSSLWVSDGRLYCFCADSQLWLFTDSLIPHQYFMCFDPH